VNLEINVMKKLQSPYCISLKEVIEDSKAVHLVEELAVGGELFDRILDSGHFSEKDAAKVTKQVMLGISHMHSMGACHRDLKPENLLMVTGDKTSPNYLDVKIADFGLSSLRPVKDASMSTVCGTPDYLAPEVILIASEGPMSRRK
jgi:serine/threonine protein kinase